MVQKITKVEFIRLLKVPNDSLFQLAKDNNYRGIHDSTLDYFQKMKLCCITIVCIDPTPP